MPTSESHVLKSKTPKTKSPFTNDLAPLPERRRSTFREPAAEVDLGLFGLPERELEAVDGSDVADATDVVDAASLEAASDVVAAPVILEDVPEAAAPVAAPAQHRARHRADRAGNRRASGSSFRNGLPAH
jgi:hypothetical protein